MYVFFIVCRNFVSWFELVHRRGVCDMYLDKGQEAGFGLITCHRFAANVSYIHVFIITMLDCGDQTYVWTLIHVLAHTTHTHTHRKGLFYEVIDNKSRFSFLFSRLSLHCLFPLTFLCFSHIETTRTKYLILIKFPPPPQERTIPRLSWMVS